MKPILILGLLITFTAAGTLPPVQNVEALAGFRIPRESSWAKKPVQINDYFFMKGIAEESWATATEQCEGLGKNWHLVSIDSPEKHEAVNAFLRKEGDINNELWTSGHYEAATRDLRFYGNIQMPPWAPLPALPPPVPTMAVAINYNYGEPYWVKAAEVESKQSICEYIDETVPVPCYFANDLHILLDSSGSIGQDHYNLALQFVSKLAVAWIEFENNTEGLTIFSDSVQPIFRMTDVLTNQQKLALIANAPYIGSGTETSLGLDDANQQFASHNRGLPRNIVTITDGNSNNPELTKEAAGRLKAAGIRMFSIGIGITDATELEVLAGDDPTRVYSIASFDELWSVLRPVCVHMCNN